MGAGGQDVASAEGGGVSPAPTRYAHVLVDVDAPLPQPFTYRIPDGLELAIGDAVLAPCGPSREVVGYIVGLAAECPPGLADKIKDISGPIQTRTAEAGEV